jgi:hypothetical protein
MKLTPIFGLPIAEPDDARRDFPFTVDDPRTVAIENLLGAAARDTGWRNITAGLINGWTAPSGYVRLRRVGKAVSLRIYGLVRPATWNGALLNGTAGFQGPAYGLPVGITNTGLLATSFIWTEVSQGVNITVAGSIISGQLLQASVGWITDEAWPTVLPGTPYP